MHNHLFSALLGVMRTQDVDRPYLARSIKKSMTYVNERFSGKREWSLGDAYEIMDLLNLPHDQINVYFPPGGRESTQLPKRNQPTKARRIVLEVVEGEDLLAAIGR